MRTGPAQMAATPWMRLWVRTRVVQYGGHVRMDDTTRRTAIEVGTVTNENTERLLTPHQVAAMFRVDPKTVTRWASNGWIGSIRTPGGHRRFRETEVRALLAERAMPAPSSTA